MNALMDKLESDGWFDWGTMAPYQFAAAVDERYGIKTDHTQGPEQWAKQCLEVMNASNRD